MGKILFISFYDDVNIGIRTLHNQVTRHGHESHVLFFKMPSYSRENKIPPKALCYEYTINDDFITSHYDVNPWTTQEIELLAKEINRIAPDVIGFSFRSWSNPITEELVTEIRSRLSRKNTIFIAGGYGPGFSPEYYLNFIDYVFIGEAEDALLDFMNKLHDLEKQRLSICNIKFRDGNNIVTTEIKPIAHHVSDYQRDVSITESSLIEKDTLRPGDPVSPTRSKYFLLAGRGCVGKCSFCSGGYWTKIYPTEIKRRRNRRLDDIFAELEKVTAAGFRYLHLVDEFFVFPHHELREIFSFLGKHVRLPFFCYLHPQIITSHPDILHQAVEAGLQETTIAVQSGSEKFSREIYNRKNNPKMLIKFSEMIHEYPSVSKNYHFITGNPLETKETFFESLDFTKKLPFRRGKDTITTFKLQVFPMSPLGEMLAQKKQQPISTKESITKGFLQYLRVVADDPLFWATYEKYKDIDDPFILQQAVRDIRDATMQS